MRIRFLHLQFLTKVKSSWMFSGEVHWTGVYCVSSGIRELGQHNFASIRRDPAGRIFGVVPCATVD